MDRGKFRTPSMRRPGLLQLDTDTNAKAQLVDAVGVLGDESNALIWDCIIRYLGSSLLAPDDVGE